MQSVFTTNALHGNTLMQLSRNKKPHSSFSDLLSLQSGGSHFKGHHCYHKALLCGNPENDLQVFITVSQSLSLYTQFTVYVYSDNCSKNHHYVNLCIKWFTIYSGVVIILLFVVDGVLLWYWSVFQSNKDQRFSWNASLTTFYREKDNVGACKGAGKETISQDR